MTLSHSSRDTEVISLRTSSDFKNRLREWADARGVPMTKLLEEMGELYARAEAGAERKMSAVELLLRPHFAALERELVRAFEEAEGKGNLYREESDSLRAAVERSESRFKEERVSWEQERKALVEKAVVMDRIIQEERAVREAAERHAREATDTARALTASLSEARAQIEELRRQIVELPALKKERDHLATECRSLAVDRENKELTLARVQEDLIREKEAVRRGDDAHRREIQAMEREFEARVAKAQLDLERVHMQRITDMERQIQNLKDELARRTEGSKT